MLTHNLLLRSVATATSDGLIVVPPYNNVAASSSARIRVNSMESRSSMVAPHPSKASRDFKSPESNRKSEVARREGERTPLASSSVTNVQDPGEGPDERQEGVEALEANVEFEPDYSNPEEEEEEEEEVNVCFVEGAGDDVNNNSSSGHFLKTVYRVGSMVEFPVTSTVGLGTTKMTTMMMTEDLSHRCLSDGVLFDRSDSATFKGRRTCWSGTRLSACSSCASLQGAA